MRVQVRDLLRNGWLSSGTCIIHVQPWIWRAATSTGKSLTLAGRDTGYEMRLSYYSALRGHRGTHAMTPQGEQRAVGH